MAGSFTLTVRDYSNETSSVTANGVTFTSGNITAQLAAQDALETAIGGMIIGTVAKRQRVADDVLVSGGKPSNPFAQREIKWLVRAVDNVTSRPVNLEIPCANLALLDTDTDRLDLTGTEAAAFVSALEAYGRSVAGNAITVVSIEAIGRTL